MRSWIARAIRCNPGPGLAGLRTKGLGRATASLDAWPALKDFADLMKR
jgi:hypothetical protein